MPAKLAKPANPAKRAASAAATPRAKAKAKPTDTAPQQLALVLAQPAEEPEKPADAVLEVPDGALVEPTDVLEGDRAGIHMKGFMITSLRTCRHF